MRWNMPWLSAFLLLCVVPGVVGDSGWDDFADNLATDLAPLITLFGERLTKQFLSESTSIIDNFIFAFAPLGILTALVSTIRVCGNSSLRAFIGRASEGPGEAENELLSCVSESTAELFNDGGISRVFGRPRILEVMVWEDTDPKTKEKVRRISTLRDALQEDAWVPEKGKSVMDGGYPPELDIPNLSLNKGIKRRHMGWFYSAALLGFLLQSGVFGYAAVTVFVYPSTFLKDGQPVESYAFPFFISGTTLLSMGMFLCAFIIERSSKECYFRPAKPSKIYWLQPGPQKVGAQEFEAFLGVNEGPNKEATEELVYVKSMRARKGGDKGPLLMITIALTLVGFVIQFIGLRGLHASVIMAEMGATLLMAIVRTGLRTKRVGSEANEFEKDKRHLASYKQQELDFFAFYLEDVSSFSLISCPTNWISRSQSSEVSSEGSTMVDSAAAQSSGIGNRLIQTRTQLARLAFTSLYYSETTLHDFPIRRAAHRLASTIQKTMNLVSSWKEAPKDTDGFEIAFICQPAQKSIAPLLESCTIALKRCEDTLRWQVDEHELEAVLGLWTWSLLKSNPDHDPDSDHEKSSSNLARLVGLTESDARSEEMDLDFHKWIYRHTEAGMVSAKMIPLPQHRFGFYSDEHTHDREILVMRTRNHVETMAAQDIYIQFLKSVVGDLGELGGDVDLLFLPGSQNGFLAHNSHLDELVGCFESSGLGSREDALLCIVPVLRHHGLLPELAGDTANVKSRVEECINSNDWARAFSILRWITERSYGTAFEQSLFELGYLCRRAMLHPDVKVQNEGLKHVYLALESDPRAKYFDLSRIQRPEGWMDPRRRSENWKDFASQLGWLAWHISHEHGDRQSFRDTLASLGADALIGVDARSVAASNVSDESDQEETPEEVAVLWLSSADGRVFSRPVPLPEDRLALDFACQHDHQAIMHWIISRWKELETEHPGLVYHMILWAAEARYTRVINSLRRHGIDIDMNSPHDTFTPLLRAIGQDMRGAIYELLDAGADIEKRDTKQGRKTCLIAAAVMGNAEIVSLLLSKGAKVNAKDIQGFSPLMWAAIENEVAVARILLDHGADVNLCASIKDTPLLCALHDDHLEMARLLLSRGANINHRDSHGCTALIWAVRNRSTEIVKLLLDHGAETHHREFGERGRTAFEYARDHKYFEAIHLLERCI